ncbi:Gfo/Idh/MocA family protein [Lachnotalea sp. AF33-28]|uniref:Gfo/Idh/MocA family protein n=1 Tax=Lachnotalea sp. AF33-28 TaxID=2292046 RepID=UPI000E473358|nr:Gfo/Idh/MocA family oxidoreductase [Lachnotalea sp. AF33-28]RHP35519.1 gfo/Idh/MocA family oxidoreductase [Lachnotalea sp. AF33-28]
MYEIAIIGYGGMGAYHAEQLLTLPEEFHLAGVYDINPERITLAKSKGIHGYDTLEELLADPSIRTVIIAVPNNFHKSLSIQAMEAGKNVICEKPVMMNAEELIEVLAVSRKTGRQFTVHQNRRWDRDFLIVKKAVEAGTLGTPFYIESRVQGSKGIPGDWRCVKEAGGGMLLDWGVHLIDQIMWMVDSPVTEVYAHLLSVKFPEVDDNFKLLLRFENGLSALVEVDTYTFINLPRWHVSGDAGTLQIDSFSCDGRIVRAKNSEMHWESGIVYTAAGPTRTMAPRPKETIEQIELPEVACDARDYYRNFRDADLGLTELIVKPEEALRVMRVIDAVFESARTHASISVRL